MRRLREWARALKRETVALWLVARHPRTPWLPRVLALLVAGYALSPIDLIPDFIPVLGYVDDLLIVPFGIWLVIRLVPRDVLAECRQEAAIIAERPISRVAALVIVFLWAGAAAGCAWWLYAWLSTSG